MKWISEGVKSEFFTSKIERLHSLFAWYDASATQHNGLLRYYLTGKNLITKVIYVALLVQRSRLPRWRPVTVVRPQGVVLNASAKRAGTSSYQNVKNHRGSFQSKNKKLTMAIDQMLPSASVEVIATVGNDGSIRTRSVATIESSTTTSSLVDGWEDPITAKRQNSEKPMLVPMESPSDSEDSFTSGEDDVATPKRSHLPVTDIGQANTQTMATTEDGAIGMYDCLSDQIANFFCPVEQPMNFCIQPRASTPSRLSTETHHLAATCVDSGCTEYQLQDFFNTKASADVFSSLQFWLTPSQKEDRKSRSTHDPCNRSATGRKRRSKHIQRLWDSWHAAPVIPLERSKSLPCELRNTSFIFDDDNHTNDACYDSDQEQECRQKAQRAEALREPKAKGFRGHRPSPINIVPENEKLYLGMARVPTAPRNALKKASDQFNFHGQRRGCLATTASGFRRIAFPMAPTENDLMSTEGEHILRSFIQVTSN